jgi:hypothetical protein
MIALSYKHICVILNDKIKSYKYKNLNQVVDLLPIHENQANMFSQYENIQ